MPSKSLIMQICYPSKNKFSTEATKYGCEHEKIARSFLTDYLSLKHRDLDVMDCGLYRSCTYPYLGATPDGIVKCSCCPHGYVIEIKCPFKCTKKKNC